MTQRMAKEVSRYTFSSEDHLFLDANVWLYLYGPQQSPASSYVRTYSDAYKRILSDKSKIYIDVLIISEFVNRYIRLKHELIQPTVSFKDFRNGPFFKIHAQSTADEVRRILKHCSRIESGFEKLNMEKLLNDFVAGGSDFNDQIISKLCKDKKLSLVTHDGDFRDPGLSVLTANRNLL